MKANHKTVCMTAGRGPGAGGMGLKGRLRGAFSGGEIQRLGSAPLGTETWT